MDDYSSIVKRLVSALPDEEDRQVVTSYIESVECDNRRLEDKNKELSRQVSNPKKYVYYAAASALIFDVIVVRLINYVTLLINPDATPIKSEIGELVKMVAPILGIGV